MKKLLLFSLILGVNFAFAQVNETFNDGNFTSNPAWTASNSGNDFLVSTEQLRSNSTTASSNFYLSTPNLLGTNCQWEFWVNLQFNPSSTNYVDVYLTSDQLNLQSANINGYFVRIGNTSDEISLYKRSGTTASIIKLIDGIDGSVNTSNNKVKIRVTRSASNVFTLERDLSGLGTAYLTEGTFQDADFTRSSYFGIFIQQSTSSFHQKHFFDDIKVSSLITDVTAPSLLSATVIDSTILELAFSEALDSTTAKLATNYNLNNGFGNPFWIKTTPDAAKYTLKFSKGLITASYLLTATGIKDKAGNNITANNTAAFSFYKPYTASKGDLVINEIFADPSPQIDLPSVEYIELYNTTGKTIKLSNWKYSDPVSTAVLPADSIKSGEYLILCAKTDTNEFKAFGKTIGISPWPSLNNASDILKLVSPENKTIDSVAYSDTWHSASKKTGGWSLERINYKSLCSGLFNWNSSTDISGGTPAKQNAAYIPNYDLQAFKADSMKKVSDSSLCIYLNKPADISATNNVFNLIPASGTVKSLSFDTNAKQVTIHFTKSFANSTTYHLTISQLKDCAGNTIGANSFSFTTPKPAPVRLDTSKLYITEIFADPSPEIKLPLAEFVEIYNPGKDTVNLDGWSLNDPATKSSISKHPISPNQYVILCPLADTLQYKSFGKTIGLSPWPSLNNASDQITLKSFTNRLVDTVSYSDSWHSPDKKQGGWSLERIDHASLCSGSANWTSSTDLNGGTPGKENNAYVSNYDRLAFKTDSIRQITDSTIVMYFNKTVNSSTAINAFSFSPESGSIKVTFDVNMKQVILLAQKPFLSNTTYQVNITNLKDCSGNLIITAAKALNFSTPAIAPPRADTSKIYITEIFADPSPEVNLPLAEFIEIYNPGMDTIDLEGWTLHNLTSKSTFKKVSILPKSYLIVCPESDTLQFKTFGNTAGLASWPVLTNVSGRILLKSFSGRAVDSISYSDTWHSPLKKIGGWSLERIDYMSFCKGITNWASSNDPSGGTPGKHNSIHVSNYDKLVFKADSVQLTSDSSLNVYFNKHADVSTSLNAFILSADKDIKSIAFDAVAKKASLQFKDKLTPNTTYQFEIRNLKDCAGNLILQNSALFFTTPKLPPVRLDTAKLYFTEIFADPSPEINLPLAEFVEIYNPGRDTVDLDGWVFGNSKTNTAIKKAVILPQSYLILCPSADTLQYKSFGKTAGLSSWPALTNSSDRITLKSFKGRLTDSISYSDTWHGSTKKQGGWSLERIDYQSLCNGNSNWISSANANGGTPGKQNSVHINKYDNVAFKADSIRQLSDTLMIVYLNKFIDAGSLSNSFTLFPNSGMINSYHTPQSNSVLLTAGNKLEANTTYKLTIAGLKDCAGNSITQNNPLTFKTLKSPQVRLDTATIYITEILADPSPEIKLPLVEFIEIFNPGKDTIDLNGWTISNSKTKSTFKNNHILPQSYLIICPSADTLVYKNFGNIAGLTPWPALTNSADQITLKSFKGRLVDSLTYQDTWYKSAEKKSGGWSLELIDPLSICKNHQNWTASLDPFGGTPGRQNSTFQLYNHVPLQIVQARLKDSVTISVTFSRPPENRSAADPNNYFVNNGLGKPSEITLNTNLTEAELKYKASISRGNTYKITVSNISDCVGNQVSTSNEAEFFYPHKILRNDLLISEILFNPRIGGSDFVEIYNNSNHLLDLKELSIASIKSPDSILSKKSVTSVTRMIKPKDFLVLSADPDNIKKEYRTESPDAFLKMSSLPLFNNDEGGVILLSGQDKIDQFSYYDKMHFALIKDPKGISLERSNFNIPANEPGNFRSASASIGYATPGYKNSQSIELSNSQIEEVGLLSKTFSPDNDGFEDALQIQYHFNEPGMVANAAVYNDRGILIRRLAKNTTLSAEGILTWDGLTENTQKAEVGIYIIAFEVFSLNGKLKKYLKPCVLAAKLN